jgi:hypothetical protein
MSIATCGAPGNRRLSCGDLAIAAAAVLFVCVVTADFTKAASVTYTIDDPNSSLTMSGDIIGQVIGPQVPGGDVDHFSGTITGNLVGNTITFTGGSNIVADANPAGPFAPNTLGTVSNYGVQGTTVLAAFRDVGYDFDTGSVTDGVAPSTTLLDLKLFPGAVINSNVGSGPLGGGSALDSSLLLATIQLVGNVETLTIPIRRESGNAGGLHIISTGQIVATRIVPEPSSMILLGLGALGLLGYAWRARKQKGLVS